MDMFKQIISFFKCPNFNVGHFMKIIENEYSLLDTRRNRSNRNKHDYNYIHMLDMTCAYLEEILQDETSVNWYIEAAKIAKLYGIKNVYDIGCAYGAFAPIFIENDIKYVGIEKDDLFRLDAYCDQPITYIMKTYPFEIITEKKSMVVSRYCVGWVDNFEQQLKQINSDFDYAFLYIDIKNKSIDMNTINNYFMIEKRIEEHEIPEFGIKTETLFLKSK